MNRLRQVFRPLRDSHAIGLIVAVLAFVGMSDAAAVASSIPRHLGFPWQAGLVAASPILCVLVCLVVSNLAPEGNRSRSMVIRAIGRIPVVGRYLTFVVVGLGTVLLTVALMNLFTFSSIQSLKLAGDIPFETSTRIRDELGDGVIFRWSGDDTEVFFLEEKRAAVERALEKEGVAFQK